MEQPSKTKLLGELLLEKGLINQNGIDFCLHEQKITGEKLGDILERFGFVTQRDIAITYAEQMQQSFVSADDLIPDEEAMRLFTLNICRQNAFLPVKLDNTGIQVSTSNRNLDMVRQIVESRSGRKAVISISEEAAIQRLLYHHYYFMEHPVERLIQNEITNIIADRDAVRPLDSLLQNIFRLAIKSRATDIHIRPMERSINVAFRIDGVLHSMLSLGAEFRRLISTIKLRAGMDIADARLPQDGSFELDLNESNYDIRVSTIISPYGESAVLRLLQRDHEVLHLAQLGFLPKHLKMLEEAFRQPAGIILLTGPTGSGKTTTLHAGIRNINLLNTNVVSVEDPIEYRLPLVRQTEVNNRAGYTFSSAIRHFLRHDPDVIMVGEIRDDETAKTAITAAETGHLVLSTLHTNNALGVIPRLRALDIENHMIADTLKAVIAQRLVRKVCIKCGESHPATPEEMQYLHIDEPVNLMRGKGCDICNHTGFRGRVPIYEVVIVNDALVEGIETGATSNRLTELARENYISMYDVARQKVLDGITTVSEVSYLANPKSSNLATG